MADNRLIFEIIEEPDVTDELERRGG